MNIQQIIFRLHELGVIVDDKVVGVKVKYVVKTHDRALNISEWMTADQLTAWFMGFITHMKGEPYS